MATTINKYIKGIMALSAICIFCSCSKPKDLKYGEITDVSVKNVGLTGADVEITIPVDNPNSYDIKVDEAAMDLSQDSKVIAHITQLYPVTITGRSKADYKVGASIKLANAGALMSLMSLMNGSKANLNLDGTLKAHSMIVTKTVQIHQTNVQDYLKPITDKMKFF